MKKNSKIVTSNQLGIHKDLEKNLSRNSSRIYQRPIADFSKEDLETILNWINQNNYSEIILDMGCGVGESTFNIAKENSEVGVIGIDKSLSRITREREFKHNGPKNCFLIRGELLDLWFLFFKHQPSADFKIIKQYILFPNPWPKPKHLSRRFHGNPIFPFILQLKTPIELRSNWRLYLQEFQYAAARFNHYGEIQEYHPENFITPFEKKYYLSGQGLFKLELLPK